MIHPRRPRKSTLSRRLGLQHLEQRQLLAADGLSLKDDAIAIDQNSEPLSIEVLANDVFDDDYAGQRRITSVSTGSLGGRIEIVDGALRYTAPADAFGTEQFRYTVDDSASALVIVEIHATLPDFERAIDHLQPEYQFDLIDAAIFPDDYSGQQKITLISDSLRGADLEITPDGRSILYRNENTWGGKDSFTYIVDDLYVGRVQLDVYYPITRDRYEVVQNSEQTTLNVLSNDFLQSGSYYTGVISPEDWEPIRQSAQITHLLDNESGEFSLADDGRSILFQPAEDSNGHASIRYVVDGRFETSVGVKIHRGVVDDAYVADVDGGQHVFDVLSNDEYRSIFDYKRRIRVVRSVTSVTHGDQGGTVTIAPDSVNVVYTPAPGFVGRETFHYVADDKYKASVSVNVGEPVRNDRFDVHQGNVLPIDVLANDFLGSDAPDAVVTGVSDSDLGATISIGNDGRILYQPPDEVSRYARDTFEYTVNHQFTATVTMSIRGVTRSDHYTVDQPVERTLRVLENDQFGSHYAGAILITDVSEPSAGGSVAISGDGKSLLYTPGNPGESFQYTVDGRFTENVNISMTGHLRGDRAIADQNGPAIEIDVLENDFRYHYHGSYDGSKILSVDPSSTEGGLVRLLGDRVEYTPPNDFFGADSFDYYIDDFLTASVSVSVVRRAADDVVRVAPESQNQVLNVRANDIYGADYQESGLISAVSASSAGGRVSISQDRASILYSPPSGFVGEDTFEYTIDGMSKAMVTVKVQDEAAPVPSEFSSMDEFRDFLIQRTIDTQGYRFDNSNVVGGSTFPTFIDVGVETTSLSIAPDGTVRGTSGASFSETNVQVAGVDEHDIVETDGDFVYTLRGNELIIVRSLPADELELVSRTTIEGSPIGMFLHGDRLTVLSRSRWSQDPIVQGDEPTSRLDELSIWPPSNSTTSVVTILDVADRNAPSVVQRTQLEGSLVDSRRIGDQVFLVFNKDDYLPEVKWTCDDNDHCGYETEEAFRRRITEEFATVLDETLPKFESFDGQGNLIRRGPLVLPEDILRSPLDDTSTLTIVTSIDMSSDEPGLSGVSSLFTPRSTTLYANASSMYLFSGFTESIENERWTSVLKFDWNRQTGTIEFAAQGELPGTVLDQFSIDEVDGQLRVVTTISNLGTGNHSYRNEIGMFILEEDGGVMEFIGSLQNLAVGHHLESVRYFGDRAFLTTFDNVDPIYAIDLSDPTSPRALGHVPIAGTNDYMQFVSADRLLTIGRKTANGYGGRSMVSLFDVSDLNSPRLIDQYALPKYSQSLAGNEHHAFGWFPDLGVLSVPSSRYFHQRYDADEDGYNEATRQVREDDLTILRVQFGDGVEESVSLHGQVSHDAPVARSVAINDHVYSVGRDAIRVVHRDDPDSLVDEVLFEWEVVREKPAFFPREFHDFDRLARQFLADRQQVSQAKLVTVAEERRDGEIQVVLRAGSEQFLVAGPNTAEMELIDDAFQFTRSSNHNRDNPMDANADGTVTALDALLAINETARRRNGERRKDRVMRQINVSTNSYSDANNDGEVTAFDALLIINQVSKERLAARSAAGEWVEPEREAVDEVLRDEQVIGSLF